MDDNGDSQSFVSFRSSLEREFSPTRPLPPFAPNITADLPVRLNPRSSRASSIVSTRTGNTIATLQDDGRSVRSLDLLLGGKVFHINRDASRILISEEQNQPPPYSPPAPEYPNMTNLGAGSGTQDSTLSEPSTPTAELAPSAESEDLENSQQHQQSSTVPSTPRLLRPAISSSSGRSNSMSNLSTIASAHQPNTVENSQEPSIWRSLSFIPGPEKITVIPKRRSASQGNIPDNHLPGRGNRDPRLHRRNGIRLPKLFTSLSGSRDVEEGGDFLSPRDPVVRSAGPRLSRDDAAKPTSPTFIGRGATAKFPLIVADEPAQVEEGHADTAAPPAMDDENDISIHYTRLIRSIDREHRKALHARDQELAAMRERLNEVDQVYRQELKARDFTIDDLRKRMENLEQQMESRLEKARNEVEDLWESRWKDRDKHLLERMRRIELESQKQVEKAVAERDEEWAAEWANKNKMLLEQLQAAQRAANQSHQT